MKPETFITVGKIGAPYGVRGWIKIHAYTEFLENILDYSPWYLTSDNTKNTWTPIEIEDSRHHGKGLIVKFKSITTPEAARLYTGQWIGIQRSQLPALNADEYYWTDLVGLTVINQHGENLGKVVYLIATGSNDVLVVKKEKKEIAIPYLLDSVIKRIDLKSQEIHVDWEAL